MRKIMKYIIRDVARSKFIFFYTATLFLLTVGLNYLNRDETKTVITVLNVVIYLMPLVNILYVSLHYYNSKEFIETLLTYPVKRGQIFMAEYFSLTLALIFSYILGVIFPLLIFGSTMLILNLLVSGILLIAMFTSISLLVSIIYDERIKGIGMLIGIWLFMAIVFDGIILIMYFLLNDFPLDKISVILIALNPIDLTRLYILINLDIASLFGYSGANFIKFFGQAYGIVILLLVSFIWIIVPTLLARRKFNKKDF
ncbi:MAG: ABC transporter permease subunit [Ignavibacteria bacterium]